MTFSNQRLLLVLFFNACAMNVLCAPPKQAVAHHHGQAWFFVLPDEVIEFILQYLDRSEWINFGLTCTEFYDKFQAHKFFPYRSIKSRAVAEKTPQENCRIIRDWSFRPWGTSIYYQCGNRHLKLMLPAVNSDVIICLEFSPNNDGITVGSRLGNVTMFTNTDPDQGQKRNAFYFGEKHHSPINQIKYSPDGQSVAAVSREGLITIWNTETKSLLAIFAHHQNQILHEMPPAVPDYAKNAAITIKFVPNSNALVSFSHEDGIIFWPEATDPITATEGTKLPLNLPYANFFYSTQESLDISRDRKSLLITLGNPSGRTMIFNIENIDEPVFVDEIHGPTCANCRAKFVDDAGNEICMQTNTVGHSVLWKYASSLEEIQQKISAARIQKKKTKKSLLSDCLCQ